jgi:hypothetical protein
MDLGSAWAVAPGKIEGAVIRPVGDDGEINCQRVVDKHNIWSCISYRGSEAAGD